MADGKWEYGQLFSDGGFLTFNESPEIEAIYPLADRLEAGMRHGGHVYRRAIIVISDWEEITPADVKAQRGPGGRQRRVNGLTASVPWEVPKPSPGVAAWFATCDWGDCDEPTVKVRWEDRLKRWLPVCADHAPDHDARCAALGPSHHAWECE